MSNCVAVWRLLSVSEDIDNVVALWESVLENTLNFPISNHPKFIFPLMKWQFPDSKLYLAVYYENEKPHYCLPLILSNQSKYGFRWNELSTPFHTHVNLFSFMDSDLFSHQKIFKQLINSSKDWGLRWDRLVLRNILSEEVFCNGNYTGDMAWFDTSIPGSINSVVSKKLCKNFSRLQRKLEKEVCEFSIYIGEKENLSTDLQDFFKLEKESWIKTEKKPVYDDELLMKFYSEMTDNFSLDNRTRIFFFRSENEIIAGALGFQMNNILYIHKICNLSRFSRYAAGSLLIHSIVKMAIDSSEIEIVSLVTSPPWAVRWHPKKARLINFVEYDQSLKGWLFKYVDPLVKKTRKKVKEILFRSKNSK